MNYSVGILYSTSEFLNEIADKPIMAKEFKETIVKYGVVHTDAILDISQKCNWIEIDKHGYCHLSGKGRVIVDENNPKIKLRIQLRDIIHHDQPTWIHKMKSGRKEIKDYLSQDIGQVFNEAGLFDKWNEKLIEWWDKLALSAHAADSSYKYIIGRTAEANTVTYEAKRTKQNPEWLSLESNNIGYDILSKISDKNDEKLRIEVKGTKQSLREASFYLTRFEWEIGKATKQYVFYLWVLKKPIFLIPVPFSEVEKHVPIDQLSGKWKTVKIPYKPFRRSKIAIKDDNSYKSLM